MFKKIKNSIKKIKNELIYYFSASPIYPPLKNNNTGEAWIFVRSWNRPLYLWACLDNLYRVTKKPCKIVLIDNASTDPLVKEIIKGFERRGLFHKVHYMNINLGINQEFVFKKYRKFIGKYFFLLDADIIIEPNEHCWTEVMIDIAERMPQLGLLGTYIDTSDFVDYKKAKQLAPNLSEAQINHLIKKNSSERRIPPKAAEVINPFNPPGRLLLLRTSIIDKVGLPIGNVNLCRKVRAAGYQQGITTRIIHRHLSLLNIFDYPNYDYAQLHKYLTGN